MTLDFPWKKQQEQEFIWYKTIYIYMVFLLYFTRTVYNTKYNAITLYINIAASYIPDIS